MRFLTSSSVLSLLSLLILPQTVAQNSLSLIPQAPGDVASLPISLPENVGIYDHHAASPGAWSPEQDNSNDERLPDPLLTSDGSICVNRPQAPRRNRLRQRGDVCQESAPYTPTGRSSGTGTTGTEEKVPPARDEEIPGNPHRPAVKDGWVVNQGWLNTLGLGVDIDPQLCKDAGGARNVPVCTPGTYLLVSPSNEIGECRACT